MNFDSEQEITTVKRKQNLHNYHILDQIFFSFNHFFVLPQLRKFGLRSTSKMSVLYGNGQLFQPYSRPFIFGKRYQRCSNSKSNNPRVTHQHGCRFCAHAPPSSHIHNHTRIFFKKCTSLVDKVFFHTCKNGSSLYSFLELELIADPSASVSLVQEEWHSAQCRKSSHSTSSVSDS